MGTASTTAPCASFMRRLTNPSRPIATVRGLMALPTTMCVMPADSAYWAICWAMSSPKSVTTCAPSSSAKSTFERNCPRCSLLKRLEREDSTTTAVSAPWYDSAMFAAVRMAFTMPESCVTYTSTSSLARVRLPVSACSALRVRRSAMRRSAISRKAARFFCVKKLPSAVRARSGT